MRLDGLSQSDIDTFCSDLKQSEFGLPKKLKLAKPEHKMKNIHWKSIQLQRINGSIWNKMNQKWDDYDMKKFESKFKVKLHAIKINKAALQNDVSVSFSTEHKQNSINFVQPKRSQKIKTGLKMFHMTNAELRDAILSMNETQLNIKLLKILFQIIPSQCEQLMAERMSQIHTVKLFGVTERYFYSLCDIMELKQRIYNWIFILEFEYKVQKLIEEIGTIETAKLIICLSKELREILKIILAFGNHMNYENKLNCNAYGFCISELNMLQEIKTSDNSMTFLMYLCLFLQRKYPKVLNIIERFKIVHQAALINRDHVIKTYELLIQQTKHLNAMIIRYKLEHYQIPNENDMFFPKMVNFQPFIQQNMEHLKLKMDTFHKCEQEIMKYFAFELDYEMVTMERIFEYISEFITQLQYNSINLIQFEQIKKQIRIRKRRNKNKQKTGQRRANTEHLTSKSMNKYHKNKKKAKKHYAVALDDIGTPLMDDEKDSIYDKRMNIFAMATDDNKTNENINMYGNKYANKQTRKAPKQPKLAMSQSADFYQKSQKNKASPIAKKTNIISFGQFNTYNNKCYNNNNILINNNLNVHSAILHSYDYSGNFNIDTTDTEDTNVTSDTDRNSAIIHSYHSEPSSPITKHNKNESSFCLNLMSSDSELIEQRFGAVLESPIGVIGGIAKANKSKRNKTNLHIKTNNKNHTKRTNKTRKF